MKKIIAVILVLLTFSFCCVGCSSGNLDKYESLICDSANDGLGIKPETDIWTGEYFKKNNMPQKSCTVLGNTYSGNYRRSINSSMTSYTTDYYIDKNGFEFGLRSDTGKFLSLNLMSKVFIDTEPFLPDIENPEEHAITFSREIASNYVDDINKYTQTVNEPTTLYKEKDGVQYATTYYEVMFVKKLDDYLTSDFITVKITSKGNLALVSMGDIGAFDNVTLDFSLSKVDESISSKINSIYSAYQVKSTEIESRKIVLTPDGDICMQSTIKLDLIDDSGNEFQTGTVLITGIGKK